MAMSDAYVYMTCNECGTEKEFEVPYMYQTYSTKGGYYSVQELVKRLKEKGWQIDDEEDSHICPDCVEMMKNAEDQT